MIDRILKRARTASPEAEVFNLTMEETPVSFEANELKQLQTRQVQGTALRLIVDGRIGFASSTHANQADSLVDTALEVAPFGTAADFQFPELIDQPHIPIYDPAIAELTVEDLIDIGRDMIANVRENIDEALCDVRVNRNNYSITIANSRGDQTSYRKTTLSALLNANLIRGTDVLDVFEHDSTSMGSLDHRKMAQEVVRKMQLAEHIGSVRTANLPVIFTPKGAAETLLLPMKLALSGKTVLEGASAWGDKVGQPAVDSRITLWDDGKAAGSVASAPFDDEGVPTRRNCLIDGGIIRGFYYDLRTASLAGSSSTGNASRSLETMPTPSPTTWIFEGGEAEEEQLIANTREGLFVDQVMGAWAGNVMAGEFSGNVHLGYKIENGELVGRVKDTMVTGNVFQALGNLDGVGKVAHRVGSEVRIPTLLFPSLSVASRG
jgi:PmbA protein